MSDFLFSKLDGFSVMENQKQQMRSTIAAAPENLSDLADEDVVQQFVERFSVRVPKLDETAMQTSEREIDIDVSRDPRRMFFGEHPNGFYLKGTEITVHIPFVGEGILFDVQPNMFSTSMPRGEVSGQELLLSFSFPHDSPPTDLKSALESRLAEIHKYLSRLDEMANVLHGELRSIAMQGWQSRKAQFAQRQSIVSGLGLPIKQTVKATVAENKPTYGRPSSDQTAPVKGEKWDAFISHASEDKEGFVKPLAEALRAAGLKIWYDEFRLEWGDSLRAKIDEGLSKSRFGIVVLSSAFFEKHWTAQELNGLAAREVDGVKVILPVWHGIGRGEVLEQSPTLADRLAISSSVGIEKIVDELKNIMGRK